MRISQSNNYRPSGETIFEKPGRSALMSALELLQAQIVKTKRDLLSTYRPYPKQRQFHEAGATTRERLLMAGNQLGKTYSGAMEMAIHLTGRYPSWWKGRRWDRPIKAWCASETDTVVRDAAQTLLIGTPTLRDEWGMGTIPYDCLPDFSSISARNRWAGKSGTPDALETIGVEHVNGKCSTLNFKSYAQGRQKWQGPTIDCVWFDEEPPLDIYIEGLTRTNASMGMVYLTFTPVLGMSEVTHMFLSDGVVKDKPRLYGCRD